MTTVFDLIREFRCGTSYVKGYCCAGFHRGYVGNLDRIRTFGKSTGSREEGTECNYSEVIEVNIIAIIKLDLEMPYTW